MIFIHQGVIQLAGNNLTWIKGVVGAAAVKNVRVRVYGPLTELVNGRVRKGSRPSGDLPHSVAQTLLNLKESWQEATQEERRELVHLMLQEVGCSISEQRVVWIKPRQEFEILFKLVDDLTPAEHGRFTLRVHRGNKGHSGI